MSALRFAGYAAIFDVADGAGDTIHAGAFRRSLTRRSDIVPLLWQHNPNHVIGTIEALAEDQRGLRVISRIDDPTHRAAHALSAGRVTGLSFGFRARHYRKQEETRDLLDIELLEISLVTHPLQHSARVHLIVQTPPAPPRKAPHGKRNS